MSRLAGVHGVAVVGAGVAGLTAAQYLVRHEVPTLVIEGDPFDATQPVGGQLLLAERVEFVPGFPDGVDGPTLIASMRVGLERAGVEFAPGSVEAVDVADDAVHLSTADTCYSAAVAVVASGGRPRRLGLADEDTFVGRGVSLCAVCDAPLFAGRDVIVVGGGDTAVDEAETLSRYARSVTIVHRGSMLDAAPQSLKRLARSEAISVRLGTVVVAIEGDERVRRVRLVDGTGSDFAVDVDGMFLAIGRIPNTEVWRPWLDVDSDGYIVTDAQQMSSRPGVFACGECQDASYRQFATAAGSGCIAGIEAGRWFVDGRAA